MQRSECDSAVSRKSALGLNLSLDDDRRKICTVSPEQYINRHEIKAGGGLTEN
jgi:hypothetical protein